MISVQNIRPVLGDEQVHRLVRLLLLREERSGSEHGRGDDGEKRAHGGPA